MPDTVGNYSDYMSIVHDYASCVEGESVYFSMNETVRNSPQANEEGNNTLNEQDATAIGDTTLQHEDANKCIENFISSTPNKKEPKMEVHENIFDISTVNKSVNGFSEMSEMLKRISTKLQTVQNKENINMDKNENTVPTSKPLEVKTMKSKKVIPQKPSVTSIAPNVRNIACEKIVNKNLGLPAPTANSQKRISMRPGLIAKPQFMRKSLIPAKLEIKDKNNEEPTKVSSTKDSTKKEYLPRKSIIPKSMSNKQVTSALKVTTKPRASLLHSQKTSSVRRSLEKLNVVINEQGTATLATKSSISNNRKTINPRKTMAKLSIAPNQKASSPALKSVTPTSNNKNNLNLRRSVAKFPGPLIKETETFECSKCKRKFRMESNYVTHLNSHNSTTSNLVCKYCDKKFQLAAALDTHLRDNCTKIPSREKRLLPPSNSGLTPSSKNNSKTSSVESVRKISYLSIKPTALDAALMKPSSAIPTAFMYQETKKLLKSLHSGVGRTPKKINMCKKCGKIFYNIFTLQAHKTCEDSDDDETEVDEQK